MQITYPPVVDSSLPAFLSDTDILRIPFQLPKAMREDNILNIAIRVSTQSNNKPIVNAEKYWDSIIYTTHTTDTLTGKSYVDINSEDIYIPNNEGKKGWLPNYYYKIQIRFCYGQKYLPSFKTDKAAFFEWKRSQASLQNFSEWSNVIITKSIQKPKVSILNDSADLNLIDEAMMEIGENAEETLFPKFEGIYVNDASEPLYEYRFTLYKGFYEEGDTPLDASGWQAYNNAPDRLSDYETKDKITSLVSHQFKYILQEKERYTVIFETRSINGFEKAANPYYFQVALKHGGSPLENISLFAEDWDSSLDPYLNENGCIEIYLRTNPIDKKHPEKGYGVLNGIYYLIRSDEHSNYAIWEDLACFRIQNNSNIQDGEKSLVYQDFTVESGIRYIYGIQYCSPSNLRSTPLFANSLSDISSYDAIREASRQSNFESNYFYHEGLQLKLTYDVKINSYKKVTLATKQDTLNSKYPLVVRNGMADYNEFTMMGKISILNDFDNSFFLREGEGYTLEDELQIPYDKYMPRMKRVSTHERYKEGFPSHEEELIQKFQIESFTTGTNDNTFIERKYREAVVQFLNNKDYKLFKSATEGNMIVTLTNVTLSPEEKLGRRIYNFSAQVVEVMDCTLANMQRFGINTLEAWKHMNKVKVKNNLSLKDEPIIVAGQIRGAYVGYLERYNHPERPLNPLLYPLTGYKDYLSNGVSGQDQTLSNYDSISYLEENKDYLTNIKTPQDIAFLNMFLTRIHKNEKGEYYFDYRDNLKDIIASQVEKVISDDYVYALKHIKSIWVEAYPTGLDLKNEVEVLRREKPNQVKIYERKAWEKEFVRLNNLTYELEKSQSNLITLVINDDIEISLTPGRVYNLEDFDIQSLYLKTTRAVIINYTAEIAQEVNVQDIVVKRRVVHPWGQVSGIFTAPREEYTRILANLIQFKPVTGNSNQTCIQSVKILPPIGDQGDFKIPYLSEGLFQPSTKFKVSIGDKKYDVKCYKDNASSKYYLGEKKVLEIDDLASYQGALKCPFVITLTPSFISAEESETKVEIKLLQEKNAGLSKYITISYFRTDDILPGYYNDDLLSNYRPSRDPRRFAVAEDGSGINGFADDRNSNLYQTLNISDIIRQKSRLEIELSYLRQKASDEDLKNDVKIDPDEYFFCDVETCDEQYQNVNNELHDLDETDPNYLIVSSKLDQLIKGDGKNTIGLQNLYPELLNPVEGYIEQNGGLSRLTPRGLEYLKEQALAFLNERSPWINKDLNNPGQYLEYQFSEIEVLEIECDRNTELIVTYKATDKQNDAIPQEDQKNYFTRRIRVGPTQKYILNPLYKTSIENVAFAQPTYAIINYKTQCHLSLKGKGGTQTNV